ncbi:MAG: hypothetical protein HYX82_03755 [Chloroflexi bacterium]|nr:hypothetical protein [Chloroflexota bacterium]
MLKLISGGWSSRWMLAPLVVGALFAFAACSQGVSKEEAAAKDRQIQDLQTQLASVQQDSTYWRQLTALMPPVELRSMTDHRAYMLPSGVLLALHFDDMDLNQAKNLNWVAWGVPGRFCKQDQERLEKQYGAGFTHFHDLKGDTHGGAPGAEGVWFVHVAVREFDAPWGHVKPGVDANFMPTPAPSCPA